MRFELEVEFVDHPKVLAAGSEAAWLYVCGLAYCARYLTDGHIPAGWVAGRARLASRLVDCGLWHKNGDGFDVHDYLEYQCSCEQVVNERVSSRERMRRVRANTRRTSTAQEANMERTGERSVDNPPHPPKSKSKPNPTNPESQNQRTTTTGRVFTREPRVGDGGLVAILGELEAEGDDRF